MLTIKIQYNQQNPSHKDMVLSIPEISLDILADSYYFVIENGFMPNDENFSKALILLKELLYKWYLAVQQIQHDKTIYLPFGFFDEFVSGLMVKKYNKNLLIKFYATKSPNGWITSDYKIMLMEQAVDWVGEREWVVTQDEFLGEILYNRENIKVSPQ